MSDSVHSSERPVPGDLIQVATVWRAHGVRGELKLIPETDDLERVLGLPRVYLGRSAASATPHRVVRARPQTNKKGTLVVAELEGITVKEAADALRGALVFADAEVLPDLEEDEFYLHDLVGLSVVTDEGETVGVVKEVLELPAQEVCVVRRPDGRETMIPIVPAFIADVDLAEKRLVIRPIEGLL